MFGDGIGWSEKGLKLAIGQVFQPNAHVKDVLTSLVTTYPCNDEIVLTKVVGSLGLWREAVDQVIASTGAVTGLLHPHGFAETSQMIKPAAIPAGAMNMRAYYTSDDLRSSDINSEFNCVMKMVIGRRELPSKLSDVYIVLGTIDDGCPQVFVTLGCQDKR